MLSQINPKLLKIPPTLMVGNGPDWPKKNTCNQFQQERAGIQLKTMKNLKICAKYGQKYAKCVLLGPEKNATFTRV